MNKWEGVDQAPDDSDNGTEPTRTYDKRLGWVNANELANQKGQELGEINKFMTRGGKVVLIPDHAEDQFPVEVVPDGIETTKLIKSDN